MTIRLSKRETKRSEVSDLESRFGGHELSRLIKSGVPNHSFRFATLVFGMTIAGGGDFLSLSESRARDLNSPSGSFSRGEATGW